MKIKPLFSIVALLFLPLLAQPTHIVGGYISYFVDSQNPRAYHFTQTVYTNLSSSADDPFVYVDMGDGNTVEVPRAEIKQYNRQHVVQVFTWSYTYGTAGEYTVAWSGVSRNLGIINIPAPSDQKSFYIHTKVKVGPSPENRDGVKLAGTPLFVAYTGEETRHNFIAYDAEGDSLTYDLIPPKTINADGENLDITDYEFPEGLTIDQFGEYVGETLEQKGIMWRQSELPNTAMGNP
jgi:hypothetical protein